jgi:hypothetical protein
VVGATAVRVVVVVGSVVVVVSPSGSSADTVVVLTVVVGGMVMVVPGAGVVTGMLGGLQLLTLTDTGSRNRVLLVYW